MSVSFRGSVRGTACLLATTLYVACAPSSSAVDAGAADAGGAGASDGGTQTDAGGSRDAGPPGGTHDAGGAISDAGGDAGATDADAGNSCGVTLPCSDGPATVAIQLDVGTNPALRVGDEVLALGVATRAQVEAVLGGPGAIAGANGFRAYHCAHGVVLYYVDDTNASGVLQGDASANDVLARVVTLTGANVTTSNGVSLGGERNTSLGSLTAPTSFELSNGFYDVSASDGLAVVSNLGGLAVSLTLFQPQNQVRWAADVDVAAAKLRQDGANVGKGSSFQAATSFLGDSYEQEGIIENVVEIFGSNVGDLQVRSYAAFGIRLIGGCLAGTSLRPCDAETEIESVVVVPPFLGATLEGLRLGDTEAEIEAEYGVGTPSSSDPSLMLYAQTGGEKLGVIYVQDESCARYAAAFVLGAR